eukprot:Nk52_evm16s276 gene=Nk52_evmTU16s276
MLTKGTRNNEDANDRLTNTSLSFLNVLAEKYQDEFAVFTQSGNIPMAIVQLIDAYTCKNSLSQEEFAQITLCLEIIRQFCEFNAIDSICLALVDIIPSLIFVLTCDASRRTESLLFHSLFQTLATVLYCSVENEIPLLPESHSDAVRSCLASLEAEEPYAVLKVVCLGYLLCLARHKKTLWKLTMSALNECIEVWGILNICKEPRTSIDRDFAFSVFEALTSASVFYLHSVYGRMNFDFQANSISLLNYDDMYLSVESILTAQDYEFIQTKALVVLRLADLVIRERESCIPLVMSLGCIILRLNPCKTLAGFSVQCLDNIFFYCCFEKCFKSEELANMFLSLYILSHVKSHFGNQILEYLKPGLPLCRGKPMSEMGKVLAFGHSLDDGNMSSRKSVLSIYKCMLRTTRLQRNDIMDIFFSLNHFLDENTNALMGFDHSVAPSFLEALCLALDHFPKGRENLNTKSLRRVVELALNRNSVFDFTPNSLSTMCNIFFNENMSVDITLFLKELLSVIFVNGSIDWTLLSEDACVLLLSFYRWDGVTHFKETVTRIFLERQVNSCVYECLLHVISLATFKSEFQKDIKGPGKAHLRKDYLNISLQSGLFGEIERNVNVNLALMGSQDENCLKTICDSLLAHSVCSLQEDRHLLWLPDVILSDSLCTSLQFIGDKSLDRVWTNSRWLVLFNISYLLVLVLSPRISEAPFEIMVKLKQGIDRVLEMALTKRDHGIIYPCLVVEIVLLRMQVYETSSHFINSESTSSGKKLSLHFGIVLCETLLNLCFLGFDFQKAIVISYIDAHLESYIGWDGASERRSVLLKQEIQLLPFRTCMWAVLKLCQEQYFSGDQVLRKCSSRCFRIASELLYLCEIEYGLQMRFIQSPWDCFLLKMLSDELNYPLLKDKNVHECEDIVYVTTNFLLGIQYRSTGEKALVSALSALTVLDSTTDQYQYIANTLVEFWRGYNDEHAAIGEDTGKEMKDILAKFDNVVPNEESCPPSNYVLKHMYKAFMKEWESS